MASPKRGEKAMKKVLAGLFVTAVAALVSMGFASTAQAYPCPPADTSNAPSTTTTTTEGPPVVGCHSVPPGDTPPGDTPPGDTPPGDTTPPKSTEVTVPPKAAEVTTSSTTNASAEASESGILPNTGGPEGALLIGGAALLAVGGAAVLVARRRQTH